MNLATAILFRDYAEEAKQQEAHERFLGLIEAAMKTPGGSGGAKMPTMPKMPQLGGLPQMGTMVKNIGKASKKGKGIKGKGVGRVIRTKKKSLKSNGKTAKVGTGERVSKAKFAYAPKGSKPSQWKLPIHDQSHVRNALARINQTKGIPQSAKPGVMQKVRRAAGNKGVGVSAKPTPKQKAWKGCKECQK